MWTCCGKVVGILNPHCIHNNDTVLSTTKFAANTMYSLRDTDLSAAIQVTTTRSYY
jgi:hypothetical protein